MPPSLRDEIMCSTIKSATIMPICGGKIGIEVSAESAFYDSNGIVNSAELAGYDSNGIVNFS